MNKKLVINLCAKAEENECIEELYRKILEAQCFSQVYV